MRFLNLIRKALRAVPVDPYAPAARNVAMIQQPVRGVVHEMVVEMVSAVVRTLEAPTSRLYPAVSRVNPFVADSPSPLSPLWPTMAMAHSSA
jgi:hypothetical protein